jgi:hypothetical protein
VNELADAIINGTDWNSRISELIEGIKDNRKTNMKTSVLTENQGGKAKTR